MSFGRRAELSRSSNCIVSVCFRFAFNGLLRIASPPSRPLSRPLLALVVCNDNRQPVFLSMFSMYRAGTWISVTLHGHVQHIPRSAIFQPILRLSFPPPMIFLVFLVTVIYKFPQPAIFSREPPLVILKFVVGFPR